MPTPRAELLLRQSYKSLFDVFNASRRKRPASLLLSSLEVKSNIRLKLLRDSALKEDDVDQVALRELIAASLVRITDDPGQFAISGRGIWQIESTEGTIDAARLVAGLDSKYLDIFEGTGPLTAGQRVILLALVAVRAFSSRSAIVLPGSEEARLVFTRVLREALDQLKKLDLVENLGPDNLFREGGTEQPLSHLMRHTDKVPKMTRGIYHALRPQRYFLEVSSGDDIRVDLLAYIFSVILGRRIDANSAESLLAWCNKVAFSEAVALFDQSKHSFNRPGTDEKMREALQRGILDLR